MNGKEALTILREGDRAAVEKLLGLLKPTDPNRPMSPAKHMKSAANAALAIEALRQLAKADDRAALKRILWQNWLDFRSLFFWAAAAGEKDIARALLDAGLKPGSRRPIAGEVSVAVDAVREGHAAALQFMADCGINLAKITDGDGNSLFDCARNLGRKEMEEILQKVGAVPRKTIRRRDLMAAASSGDIALVEAELDRGADIETIGPTFTDSDNQTRGGQTVLMIAAAQGNLDLVNRLLDLGAKVDGRGHPDRHGRTPLMEAAEAGHLDVVKRLLSAGAEVDAMTRREKKRPLTLAAKGGHAPVVAALIKAGGDSAAVHHQSTALLEAIRPGGDEVVKLLLAQRSVRASLKKVVHRQLGDGKPFVIGHEALHRAARKGLPGIASQLIRAGVDPNCKNDIGNTPLDTAASMGGMKEREAKNRANAEEAAEMFNQPMFDDSGDYPATIRELVALGADPNFANHRGATPLMSAHWGPETTKVLLELGAEVNAKDKSGYTALKWAKTYGTTEVIKILLDAGAKDVPSTKPRRK